MRFILVISVGLLIAYWFVSSPIEKNDLDITGSVGLFIFIATSEIIGEIRKGRNP